jgi:hypothetical protein
MVRWCCGIENAAAMVSRERLGSFGRPARRVVRIGRGSSAAIFAAAQYSHLPRPAQCRR